MPPTHLPAEPPACATDAHLQPRMHAGSHGCMRVERPREFAAILLRGQGCGSAEIEAAIADGGTLRVPLDRPVPIHVLYPIACVAAKGAVHLRKDIYGWDAGGGSATRRAPLPSGLTNAAAECAG